MQKPSSEETFLMEYSLLEYTWKITNDTRTIQVFECRKRGYHVWYIAFWLFMLMINGEMRAWRVHVLPDDPGMAIPRCILPGLLQSTGGICI